MFGRELVFGLHEKAGFEIRKHGGILNHEFGVSSVAGFLARKLNEYEVVVDIQVVENAGALHDIGRLLSEDETKHAMVGADFLRQKKVDEKIVRIVEAHSFYTFPRGQFPEPTTWEGRIIHAADLCFAGEIMDMWKRIEDVIRRCPGVQEEWLWGISKKIYWEIRRVIQTFPFAGDPPV